MEIEVDHNEDNSGYTWLPAVYVGDLGLDFHMVKYKSLVSEGKDGFQNVRVHLNRIRPHPPEIENKDFELLEKVDALRGSIWTVGVITKFLAGKRYIVTFRHEKKEVELDSSELRPHMDWTDERWVNSKGVVFTTGCCEKFMRACKDKSNEIVHLEKGSCSPSKSLSSFTPIDIENQASHVSHKLVCQMESSPLTGKSSFSINENVQYILNNNKSAEVLSIREDELATEKEVRQMDNPATTMSAEKRETSEKSQFAMDNSVTDAADKETSAPIMDSHELGAAYEETPELVMDDGVLEVADKQTSEPSHDREKSDTLKTVDEPKETLISEVENSCQPPVESDNIEMRCEVTTEQELPELQNEDSQTDVEACIVISEAILATKDCTTEKLEALPPACSNLIDPQAQVSSEYTQVSADDQASPHEDERNSGKDVTESGDTGLTDMPNLPFVKWSPFWQFLESMEVFRKFRQKPHFQQLLKCEEAVREGLAVGHMVNYANLINTISKLQENDSREYIDAFVGGLAQYEELGFDVKVVQDRLNKLLNLKVEVEGLADELKGIGSKIEERTKKKFRIDGEVDDIDNEIKKLTGKRALLIEESTEHHSKIMKLSSEVVTINTELLRARESVRNLVAAFSNMVSTGNGV